MGETGSSYSVTLLMRRCMVKLCSNLSLGICGYFVLLPKELKTGTRLDAALTVSALCSVCYGNW